MDQFASRLWQRWYVWQTNPWLAQYIYLQNTPRIGLQLFMFKFCVMFIASLIGSFIGSILTQMYLNRKKDEHGIYRI